MEKQKRWQFYLILTVILLTFYNILPTLFYYSKPLKKSIGEKEATVVAREITERVNSLEEFTLSWLKAQSKNVGVKPLSISLDKENPRLASITFAKSSEANLFAQSLNRAGALIPFVPAELSPMRRTLNSDETTVTVQRRIGVHLNPADLNHYFHYIAKQTPQGEVSSEYRDLVDDRAVELAIGFGGVSTPAKVLAALAREEVKDDALIPLARTIVEFENAFGDQSPITKRYFAGFTQTAEADKEKTLHLFISRLESLSGKLNKNLSQLKEKESALSKEEKFLEAHEGQKLKTLENQKNVVDAALSIVKRNISTFQAGEPPLTQENLLSSLKHSFNPKQRVEYIEIGSRNPFVDKLQIDWNKDTIDILLHSDVNEMRAQNVANETQALQLEKLNQLLYNEIALAARFVDETISPALTHFTLSLNQLTNSSSLLSFDMKAVAYDQMKTLKQAIDESWKPSGELSHENYPLYDQETFKKLSAEKQKLSLLFYAPLLDVKKEEGFRNNSLYIIAKDLGSIAQKYRDLPESTEKQLFENDFKALVDILKQNGFIGYQGLNSGLPAKYRNDFIFELDDWSANLLAATRENFSLKGSKQHALLEFTDVEQRILTLNKIETKQQEELVKWKDEYNAAHISLDSTLRYDVPKPTKNVFLNNMKLSILKYFRGDERKIIRWGLDLSGGKTVRIGLKDRNNHSITNEDDLKQAMSELYNRVNRLGVSEVSIRQEGSTIVLDFPGSQGFSASELIRASAMYFHVVNEKFSPNNPTLAESVNAFLEGVWNEAVITGRTDPESINYIAWQHLGGDPDSDEFHPTSNHAKLLYDNGLRFAGPKTSLKSNVYNDTLSQVTLFRGTDFTDWQGQTNPLLIVFHNFALEGANLTNIQVGYDPSEGNTLSFGVRSSGANEGERTNPQDDFYTWTSQFSEEKIAGTPKENFSQGRGWRMAVILNGSVISAPTLNSALKNSARITGHFSQREINQLAADLKAGSLSFTPQILSEENVSPDLGKEQRTQGIIAAALGVILVLAAMCIYYRFGGFVASIAVLFNLLMIWAVLQNLGAVLTLAGIAGIILSIGMSVDANVLVFERIREEFAQTGRLPLAIQTGYKKAFSAIVDSNLTTIIAALILLNFDSGPIKGFALTLIIGILSSMFTALFMTRYFFSIWVQNPKHKVLTMLRMFKETSIDFLAKARFAIVASVAIIVIGLFFLFSQRETLLGMDFTGGYALTLDLKEKPDTDYRLSAAKALEAAHLPAHDFQIRELSRPNYLRIQLSRGMELKGMPFYEIDQEKGAQHPLFLYQANPRILWVVNALQQGGLELTSASLPDLHLHWTEMSGQLSNTMRNQALLGLGLALLAILIYVTIRFEFKYAISATLGLAHDLLITLGLLAIFHLFYKGLQIDLQVVAALVTIIGYSLNDTIIIFDRIREDLKVMRKLQFKEIVNHALNATLSRTLMTSGTTLLVLLALVFIGGSSIFNFSLIMAIGVVIGTLSSLFIAAPLLVYFYNRETVQRKNVVAKSE